MNLVGPPSPDGLVTSPARDDNPPCAFCLACCFCWLGKATVPEERDSLAPDGPTDVASMHTTHFLCVVEKSRSHQPGTPVASEGDYLRKP